MNNKDYNAFMDKVAAFQEKVALSPQLKSWYSGRVAGGIPRAAEDFKHRIMEKGFIRGLTSQDTTKDLRRAFTGASTAISNKMDPKWFLKGMAGMRSPSQSK